MLSNTIFLVRFVTEKPEVAHDSKKHKKQVCLTDLSLDKHVYMYYMHNIHVSRYRTANVN